MWLIRWYLSIIFFMNCKIMKIKCVSKRLGQNLRILLPLLLGVFVKDEYPVMNLNWYFKYVKMRLG